MQVAQFEPSSYALVPLHMDRPIETVIPTPEHRISRICFHPLFRPLIAQTLSYMGGLMIGVQTAQLRRLLSVALAIALSIAAIHLHTSARARSWAASTVRMLVARVPGSSVGLAARLFAERFAERWGKPVIVENRPGADGI